MTPRRLLAVALLSAAVVALSLTAAGCGGGGKKTTQPPPPADQPPDPNSPGNAVLFLQWAIQHRDTTRYRSLFTNDFAFTFVASDTSIHFPGTWGRVEERASARHLFVEGVAGRPAASQITMTMVSNTLTDLADPRPGKDPTLYRMVTPSFGLTVQKSDGSIEYFSPQAVFYLVRGDAASIPADLGIAPSTTRWFIDAWQDRTGGQVPNTAPGPGPAHALPTVAPTWGGLKFKYLPPQAAL